jgi:citrate lyase beta subunit
MLPDSVITRLDGLLRADDEQRTRLYPGGAATRQPVHTVYVPADRFGADTITDWGAQALAGLDAFGPLPHTDAALTDAVRAKLTREPIEDLRIDFEDGFGNPGDPAEDEAARTAATAVARMSIDEKLPAFIGLRMKSLEPATRARAVRTVDLFLDTLLPRVALPAGFRITLPKLTSVAQVEAMVELCASLESTYGIGRLSFELQIETPQAVLSADGTVLLAPMLHAAAGRCVGLHYGTYDYSAALGIAAPYQSMEHPAADQAKALMQVAVAGTGVTISDGSTNILPLGDAQAVHAAWQLHYRLVRRSLERGFYQGWDLHPAQLPTRYAATFAFYQEGLVAAAARVRAYVERSESSILDEPATAVALAGYLLRGLDAGALTAEDVQSASGLTLAELAVLGRRSPS